MIINILISIVFYFILLYLSVNLIGLLARGLFPNPELDRLALEGGEFIKQEVKKAKRGDAFVNIIALILIIAYFYLLFYFWNIGVVAVALMIMTGRLPYLIWEIKNGKKITPAIAQTLPHNAMYYISGFLPWFAVPVLYYFLYIFK